MQRNKLAEFLASHHRTFAGVWIFAVVLFLSVIPVGYYAWWHWVPIIWAWVFEPPVWRTIVAVLILVALVVGPFAVLLAATTFGLSLADATVDMTDTEVAKTRDALKGAENDALDALVNSDEPGLLPLLKYSRAQLDAYYTVGLGQARRSFVNSVAAMWLGFCVLLIGLALPLFAPYVGLNSPPPGRNFVLGAGAIIEFISAAFLWVYRSATSQLSNFYNRQMHTHSWILCFRIATTIEQSSIRDQAKQSIVETVLGAAKFLEKPEIPASPSRSKTKKAHAEEPGVS